MLFCLVLGILLSWISYDMTAMPAAYGVLKNTGLWVFAGAAAAYFSRSKESGALSAGFLGIGRLAGTFLRPLILGQGSANENMIFYFVFAVMLGLIGYVSHCSREAGWTGALCGAIPVSYLIAEGFPAVYSRSFSLIFDMIMAGFLFFIIFRDSERRIRSLPFIMIFSFLMIRFDVISGISGVYL